MSNDETAEKRLWDELWGCINYLKMPYDTVLSMPVYIRKFWILKHNEVNNPDKQENGKSKESIDGLALNSYAQMEQNQLKNSK